MLTPAVIVAAVIACTDLTTTLTFSQTAFLEAHMAPDATVTDWWATIDGVPACDDVTIDVLTKGQTLVAVSWTGAVGLPSPRNVVMHLRAMQNSQMIPGEAEFMLRFTPDGWKDPKIKVVAKVKG